MGTPSPSTDYRELRRSDLPSFEKVILEGMGIVERVSGAEVGARTQLQSLRGLGLWSLVRLLQALRIAPLRFLVAVEGGRVVGTTLLTFRAQAGYIAGVATDAPARGRGIATHLMERAHELTRAKGKPWLALDVESENETALRVYRRLGYAATARFDWLRGTHSPDERAFRAGRPRVALHRQRDVGVDPPDPAGGHPGLPPPDRAYSHSSRDDRPPVARRPKTWKLTSGGRVQGVVRALYSKAVTTGFVLPIGTDPSLTPASLTSLLAPALEWHRSQGATRIILVVPEPVGGWAEIATALQLPRAVSTTLMVRPSAR